PVAVVDGAIVLARDHHVGTAGREVIHGRPRPGARRVARSREVLWDDVRMHVDDHAKAPCRGTGFVSLLTNRRPLGAPLRARAQPAQSIHGGRLRKGGEAPLRVYLSHCRRAFRKSSIWNGLEITKSTPRCTASAGGNKSRQPVMSPTGVAGRGSFTAWATSHPPSPGMARSVRTTSKTSASSLRTAESPSAHATTLWPSSIRISARASRTCGSSSTRRMRAPRALIESSGVGDAWLCS